jgi:hypothetical protein
MDFETMCKKALKYMVCGMVVFLSLKFVIKNDMSLIDIALLSVIAMLIFMVVENVYAMIFNDNKKGDSETQNCQEFCKMKEHMTNDQQMPSGDSPTGGMPIAKSDAMMGTAKPANGMPTAKPPAAMVGANTADGGMAGTKPPSGMPPAPKIPPAGMMSGTAMVPKNIMDHDSHSEDDYISQEESQVSEEDELQQVIKQEELEDPRISQISKRIIEQDRKVRGTKGKEMSEYDRFQRRFAEIIEERKERNPEWVTDTKLIDRNDDGSYKINVQRRSPDIRQVGSRAEDGVMRRSEMDYDIKSYHIIPQNVDTGNFEFGYSFLPPKDWYPTPPFPPVCVTEKQCPVCPAYTSGTNLELKEWNNSRRITPPDEINVRYVEEKLNSGR